MNDKEKIKNALEMVEIMIIEVENMHNARLKAMGQITKVLEDKQSLDELIEMLNNMHIAHLEAMEKIKKILEDN